MAKGFKHGAGGGTSLNFKVVGNPQPANPKVNTIWVDTDAEITGWVFAAEQPETATEGMVWFFTGTTGPVEFNALKKNCIQVYPLSAKQYIGGTFVSKSAEIYQSGAWNGLVTYLYNKGDTFTDLTGGWKVRAWSWASGVNGERATLPTATYNAASVKLYQDSTSTSNRFTGIWETVNDIDLTDFDTISFHVLSSSFSTKSLVRLGAFVRGNASANTAAKAYVEITAGVGSEQTYTVDVSSLTGSYSIGVLLAAYTTDITMYVDEVKLLKS